MVCDVIVSEEALGSWCPEKEHEIVIGVPGCKCMRNESIDQYVSGREVLLLRHEVVGSTMLGHLVLRHEEVGA
jgi:hypothetical protein